MQENNDKNKVPKNISSLYPIFIFLSTIIICFLAFNVSSNSTINNKKKIAKNKLGIIQNIFLSNDSDNSITNIKNNIIRGNITLSDNQDDQRVINISIKNIYDYSLVFEGIKSDMNDINIYSNPNIIYDINNINIADIIKPNEIREFQIVFKYKDNIQNYNGKLSFYLNLVFKDDITIILDDKDYVFISKDNKLTSINLPQKNGYKFLGYYDINGEIYYNEMGKAVKEISDDKINLYSKWS